LVEAHLGALHLNAALEFTAPWTVIFGPSGSGKSSLLRAMCSLLQASRLEFAAYSPDTGVPDTGAPDGSAPNAAPAHWTDIDSASTTTPPHLRHLAYAPQGAILFPHLTVRENVAFALNSSRQKVQRENIRRNNTPREATAQPSHIALDLDPIDKAIELFALTALASRKPRDLSGGERQRVNLARAFAVPAPRLMLLDEPFTGVDRALRDTLLPRMQQHLAARGIPAISVTHDVEEALLLRADVIRLDAGQVIAQGPALQTLAAERQRMLRVLGAC
jgi:molybdate transport system ATP-binding protein